MMDQILEMFKEGRGIRAIERCTGVSRNTVRKVIREYESKKAKEVVKKSSNDWRAALDWELIQSETTNDLKRHLKH